MFEKPKPAPRDLRAWARAREEALKILETHNPEYLDPAADVAIRQRFRTLLP